MSDRPGATSSAQAIVPDISTAAFTVAPFECDTSEPLHEIAKPPINPFLTFVSTPAQAAASDPSGASDSLLPTTAVADASPAVPAAAAPSPWAQFASLFNAAQPVLGLTPQSAPPTAVAQPPPDSPELAAKAFALVPSFDFKPIDFTLSPDIVAKSFAFGDLAEPTTDPPPNSLEQPPTAARVISEDEEKKEGDAAATATPPSSDFVSQPGSAKRHKVKIIPRSASKNVDAIASLAPGKPTDPQKDAPFVAAAIPPPSGATGFAAMPQFTEFKFESPTTTSPTKQKKSTSKTEYVMKTNARITAAATATDSHKSKLKRSRPSVAAGSFSSEALAAKHLRRDARLAKKMQAREERISRGEAELNAAEVSPEEVSEEELEEEEQDPLEMVYCDAVPVDPYVPARDDWTVQRKPTTSADLGPTAYDAKLTWSNEEGGVQQFCILQLLAPRLPMKKWAVWCRQGQEGSPGKGELTSTASFDDAIEQYEAVHAWILKRGTCVETNTARVTQPMPLVPGVPILASHSQYSHSHLVSRLEGEMARPEESCLAECELRKKYSGGVDKSAAGTITVAMQIIESITLPKEYHFITDKVGGEPCRTDTRCSSLEEAFARFDAMFLRLTGRPFADRWDVESDLDTSFYYRSGADLKSAENAPPGEMKPLVQIKIAEAVKSKEWRKREEEQKAIEAAKKEAEEQKKAKTRVRKFESRFPPSSALAGKPKRLPFLLQTLVSHVLSFLTRRQWHAAVRVCRTWASAGRLPSAASWMPVREWKGCEKWETRRVNQVVHVRHVVKEGTLTPPPAILFSRLRKLTIRWPSVLAPNATNLARKQEWLVFLKQIAEFGKLEEMEVGEHMFEAATVTPKGKGESEAKDDAEVAPVAPLSPSFSAAPSMDFFTSLPLLRVLDLSVGRCVWTTFLPVLPQLHALENLSIPDQLSHPQEKAAKKDDGPLVTSDDIKTLLEIIAGLPNLRTFYVRAGVDEDKPGNITDQALMGEGAPVFSSVTCFRYEHLGGSAEDFKAYVTLGQSFPNLTRLEILQQTRWGDEVDDDMALSILLSWRQQFMTALISGLKAIGHCLRSLTVLEAPMTPTMEDLMAEQSHLLYFEHPRDAEELAQLFAACPHLTECHLGCEELVGTNATTWCRFENASLEQMRTNAPQLTSLHLHEPSDSLVHLALGFPALKELHITANDIMFPDTREDLGVMNRPACGRLRYVHLSHITMTRINFDLLQILPYVDVLEATDSSLTLPMLIALAQFVPLAFQTSRQVSLSRAECDRAEVHEQNLRAGKSLSELTDILPVPSEYFTGLEELFGADAASIITRTPLSAKHAAAWKTACHIRTSFSASRRCLSQVNFFRFRRMTIQDVPDAKKSMRLEDCLGMDEETRFGVTEGHCRLEIARQLATRMEEFECRQRDPA